MIKLTLNNNRIPKNTFVIFRNNVPNTQNLCLGLLFWQEVLESENKILIEIYVEDPEEMKHCLKKNTGGEHDK